MAPWFTAKLFSNLVSNSQRYSFANHWWDLKSRGVGVGYQTLLTQILRGLTTCGTDPGGIRLQEIRFCRVCDPAEFRSLCCQRKGVGVTGSDSGGENPWNLTFQDLRWEQLCRTRCQYTAGLLPARHIQSYIYVCMSYLIWNYVWTVANWEKEQG